MKELWSILILLALLLSVFTSCGTKPPALLGSLPLEEESSYHGNASLSTEHHTASGDRASPIIPALSPSPSPSSKTPESSPDQPLEMPNEADRAALTDWLWWLTNKDLGETLTWHIQTPSQPASEARPLTAKNASPIPME